MPKASILLVEDDQFLREVYSDALSNAGLTFDTAVDGEEALSKLKNGGYDLVLLDIILPKIEAFEIIQRLKSDPPLKPNKSIIFLTNIVDEAQKLKAMQFGVGYIVKSEITPDDLIATVKKYVH